MKSIYYTLAPYLNLSILIDSTRLLNSEIQYSTSFLDPFVMPKPSSMYLLKNFGHTNFGSCLVFSFRFFSSFASYKLAKIGAMFVPMIKLKICWKYLPWNSIKPFSNTISNKSVMNSAFEIMSLYSNTYSFINSIACLPGMSVYRLLKSTVKGKRLGQTFPFPFFFNETTASLKLKRTWRRILSNSVRRISKLEKVSNCT